MKFTTGFREQMGGALGSVQHEFDLTHAVVNTWSNVEHHDDGTHGAITADALTYGGPWRTTEDSDVTVRIVANTDNFRPPSIDTATELRISTDAARNLTGLYNNDITKKRYLLLVNVGSFDLVLKHNVTSAEQYRFACPGSVDLTVNSSDSVWLFYDKRSANWRVIGV